MNPIKSNRRGTYVLKRKFRGVSPIRRATGTTDPDTFKGMDAMLQVLYGRGRLDLLEAVADGSLPLMVLYHRFQSERLDLLPTADVLPPLLDTFAGWIDRSDVSDATRRGRRDALVILKRYAAERTPLSDLPAILRSYRADATAHGSAFNHARASIQAFLRDRLGKSHPLYARVADVPALRHRPKKKARPFSPKALHELMKAMGHPHGLMAWTMATTGMGPKEYFEDGFEVLDDRILVHGQKREQRDREVPRVSIVTEPQRAYSAWVVRFRMHAKGHGPYDLRRTYANLLVEAGIPSNRRSHYMGHGPRTMTELYEQPEISRWLREDAAAIRGVLGEPEPVLRVIKAG